MYAAAGGASIASRQARRKIQKHHTAPDVVHQQFQKRFNQLQAQHAPASADHYNQRQQEQLLGRLPDNCRHFELKEPFPLHKGHPDQHLLRTAPVGLHSRLPSYIDLNGRITGFGSSDISEGKAATAWSERERRTSATDATQHRTKQREAHGRWIKRNRRAGLRVNPDMRKFKLIFPKQNQGRYGGRKKNSPVYHPEKLIHDSSFGGSSSEDEDVVYAHQSAAANALLYVGLGTVAIGLVIAFVGTGEKGFKTLELRLIGPTLIGSGVLCCLVRIFLCVCPTRCVRRRFRHRHRRKHVTASPGAQLNKHSFQADKSTDYYRHLPYSRAAQEFMLEQPKKNKKRVSIIPAGQNRMDSELTRPIPQIQVPSIVSSENLLEMNKLSHANTPEDTNSLSSEDSFNEQLLLAENGSVERLNRLKSTLTFDDGEINRAVTRIEEEDSEALEDSAPTSPMLNTDKRELVLSPAKLQGD
ncbi:uncharacterized protein LOC129000129 isoform X1 [Macrosteles quadrilineatus]|uniref:uncharacterized protein LOC129000129 isoform X1 n=1 Tax=Macrosteles quadrilineatus TaxID=74068 RepID=UPI0023E0C82A|nr:uncharacterized protein LOC129000129 isoform X1 [Macrosteles quadrilineatus]XP_054283020.1 uncharacterized protein LOC129000129 isoform X1 [Macrosteles quadrilineatus]